MDTLTQEMHSGIVPSMPSSGINPDRPPVKSMNTVNSSKDGAAKAFFDHSSAKRINTDAVIVETLTKQYPTLELVIVPAGGVNLTGYAAAGFASIELIEESSDKTPPSLIWDYYVPPASRLGGATGAIANKPKFAKYSYRWQSDDFIIYYVEGRDGTDPYGPSVFYILTSNKTKAHQLMLTAGQWTNELHNQVWVFEDGWWQKSTELFDSFQKSSWDVVILDPDMKKSLIEDHLSFYRSHETYAKLKVPWKRGLIYHGPPGNGKTISIKATMKMLYDLDPKVVTLYVRSLRSYMGPEYSVKQIFEMARRFAPCYLVLEDLDTIITPDVRSYFFNEVDGLKSNEGVFMIGSTNHLDRLDPGISKRPSRFDRKYYFPDPNQKERVAYCRFWQKKLADNHDIEFPDELCDAIAGITDKFSFAYMQEAFVASLLAIARRGEDSKSHLSTLSSDADEWVDVMARTEITRDLDKLELWVEIKKQVALLREGLDAEK
jgi:transitional endoplasmic reticulum ATPase